MKCSVPLYCFGALLGQWKERLADGQSLSRGDAFRLMRRTLSMTQHAQRQRGTSFLASKGNSITVWRVLARQNISWKDCLTLMKAQLGALSPHRRDFVQHRLSVDPRQWIQLPHVFIGAWQINDDMLTVFTRLLASETIVHFASTASAVVRERPQLGGVLPVVSCVLMRCYELGEKQPDAALSCCRVLALENADKLPKSERELLAFGYAMLFAFKGQWNVALSVVNAAREVRPSAKRLFWLYTSGMSQWVKAIESVAPVESSFLASSIEFAPNWLCALRTYERWSSQAAAYALLARKDCISVVGWEASLRFCAQYGINVYGVLRPILGIIPTGHPQRMQIIANAIRLTCDSMYPGTLCRRAFRFVQRGEWAEAIGLLCGCRYHDVALPLAPYAPIGTALPHELLAYEAAVHRVKLFGDLSHLTSFEELLAVALHGNWERLGNVQEDIRLKSLMSARGTLKHSPDLPTLEGDGEIQCFTFQSEEISRLVCRSASKKAQLYFRQVVPKELHMHHFGTRRTSEVHSCSCDRYAEFLLRNEVVADGDGCNVLCAMIVEHLRSAGRLCGESFVREVSQCLASGKVQLPAAVRHELPLAVLRAAVYFHRLDAALTVRIALATPSHFLIGHAEALESCVSALALTGKWERAVSLIQRSKPPYPRSFVTVVYVAPRIIALNIIRTLLRSNPRDRWTLLLKDLLHGDTRLAADELRALASRTRSGCRKKDTEWRRHVIGACCSLVHSSQAMYSVMHAANLSCLCALDLDDHGLQRLLHVLPWEKALTAISDVVEDGRVVDEHWLLIVCAKAQIPLDAVSRGVSFLRYSLLLNAVRAYYAAVQQGVLCTAVKATYRYQELAVCEHGADATYLRPFVLLLRGLLLHYNDDAWRDSSVWLLVRRLFNRVVEGLTETKLGREGRQSIPVALRQDKPLHALLVVGFLYHNLSRALQIPIPAKITSRLLRSAVYGTEDYMAALYFFKNIKHPSDYERSLLVLALRDVGDAMTLLLTTGRFVHPRPEQVLLWSDSCRGSERWLLSIELLSQHPPPREKLLDICRCWTWAEALRALELLRRIQGSSPEAHKYAQIVRECHSGMAATDVDAAALTGDKNGF